MAEPNGQNSGSERLDRIERALERVMAAHEEFTVEHKQLLTAQIVLTDNMNKLAQAQAAAAQAHQETEDRLTILIKMMDEWIRRNPAPPQ
jgi:hypothetical protein